MGSAPTPSADRERHLIEAARDGDEDAYRMLVEGRHDELQAHCYRMLGSVHDAEDALQDALLRARRGLPRFDGRSSLRAWLYRIATNTSLDVIARRPARVLATARGSAAGPSDPPGAPLVESIWIEPYPDARIPEDASAGPEARYEQREGVELAFVAALQMLPARQRAALILRDVLGFSARETAETLETTVASVNSALQRARATLAARLPERSQQATLRDLGDERVGELADRYARALQGGDVDALLAMLTEDATWSMPPLPTWYRGHEALRGFLVNHAMTVRWRHAPTRVNGQLALGCYGWDASRGRYVAAVLDVITLRGDRIAAVDAFGTAEAFTCLATGATPIPPSPLLAAAGLPETLPPD
nr:sigma-70 family RNA polymerase sigma factor [Miltoncostaea oceani]